MPPKRNHRQKNNKPPISGAGAMSDCFLPQCVMYNIVTRLPVKSIHRFKAVCKPWRKLFATPKFMKEHHAQLSRIPGNQSLLIDSFIASNGGRTMSLFRIEPNEVKKIMDLDHPFHIRLCSMDIAGSCKGLLCLSHLPHGQLIYVWNPALKMCKMLPLPRLEAEESAMVSLGFGYDDESDDFKVVRVISDVKERKGKKIVAGAEVYSCNSDSWKTVKVSFPYPFSAFFFKNDAVVSGNPWWLGNAYNEKINMTAAILFWFDLRKMVLDFVPTAGFECGGGEQVSLVEWKGSAAILTLKKNSERVLSIDVWVFKDVGEIGWTKNRSFGPIELKVDRVLRYDLNNGEIIGECPDGKLFVLCFDEEDLGGGGVKKEIVIDGALKRTSRVHKYTESLAYIKGMKK